MLIKVLLATILTLGIGATGALAAGKTSKKAATVDAYASVTSVPNAEDRLFERAKGGIDGS